VHTRRLAVYIIIGGKGLPTYDPFKGLRLDLWNCHCEKVAVRPLWQSINVDLLELNITRFKGLPLPKKQEPGSQ
jgi:hypothetical protein